MLFLRKRSDNMKSETDDQDYIKKFLDSLPTYHQKRKTITSQTLTGHRIRIDTTVIEKDDKK